MSQHRRKLLIAGGSALLAPAAALADTRPPQNMYGLIGKMAATPGQRDALISLLLEGSGSMPGCRSYVIAKDPKSEDTIWITEVWDSEQSHKASLSLPSVRQAITKARPLIASFGDFTVTEPVGGVGLNTR